MEISMIKQKSLNPLKLKYCTLSNGFKHIGYRERNQFQIPCMT